MDEIQRQPKSASGRTSSTADSIKRWLIKLAALYNYEIAAPVYEIWIQCLASLTEAQVEGCFRRIQDTFEPTNACPFPVPAHVLKLLDNASGRGEAESAWQSVLKELEQWSPYLPNTGREMSPRVNYAVKATGGWNALYNCAQEHLPFRKKDFLEAFGNYQELESLGLLEPTSRDVLEMLRPIAERKRIQ